MKDIPYTLTSESVTVVVDGTPHTFQKGTPNYAGLRKAIFDEDWDAIPGFLTVASSVEQWAKGEFSVRDGHVYHKGTMLPESLNRRIVAMAGNGEDPTFLFRFWERLQRNPSWRSVQQLFSFLEHEGIPIDPDGYFLAYKGVNANLTDCHSGKVDNTPGQHPRMDRNLVSDDPDVPCHFGFHVGALSYAKSFGPRVVICKVDPEHVVSVPKDYSYQKMRVCEYEVLGYHAGGLLPSTTFEENLDYDPDEDPDYDSDYEPTVRGHRDDTPEETIEDLFAVMDGEDGEDLMERDIMTLRRYAALHLKIVGASKIPGGKASLLDRILTIRDGGDTIGG